MYKRLRSLENWDDASVLVSCHHLRRRRRKRKITVLLFQICLPVKLVWKWVFGRDLRLLSWTAWTHVFSLKKNKLKIKIQHQVEMWESRFTGRIKATIIRNALSHSSSSLLHPMLSTAIYSTWPLALHGTTRNEFSVWSHMNKGIERKDKLVIKIFCSLCKKQTGFFYFFLSEKNTCGGWSSRCTRVSQSL